MSTFVLVHGSWFGSWSWEEVVQLLQHDGHVALAIDLPGYGDDRTPPADITFDSFVDRVCEVVDAQPDPVVLVGHSRGGVLITQAAEQLPDRIALLVYVCAFLPADGESLLQLAQQDTETIILPHLEFAEELGYVAVRDEGPATLEEVFGADCSDEVMARAVPRLRPDALAAVVTPVATTEERFGRVPRAYIQCLRDRAIGPSLQRRMFSATPCDPVITMDTSHSPFFSAPHELAGHLLALSAAAGVVPAS